MIPAVVVIMFLFVSTPQAAAQDATCQVGARVQVEMIGDAVGTITEIGREVPHAGWYRVVFDWNVRSGNAKGEWYNPKNREIRIAGTDTKCAVAGAEGKPPAASVTPGRDECPMNEPPGQVTKTATASAQLFKRVIYDSMAAKVNEKSIGAPKQIGLTFLEFEMANPYRNTLTSDRVGDKRLHDGAPVDAMIYPVRTKYLRCELYDREINGYVRQSTYACFKNRDGEWDCPVDGTTKTLERKTIPLK